MCGDAYFLRNNDTGAWVGGSVVAGSAVISANKACVTVLVSSMAMACLCGVK